MDKIRKKALDAYPVDAICKTAFTSDGLQTLMEDNNEKARMAYMEGYRRALEDAKEWLRNHAGEYWYDDYEVGCPDELIEDFENDLI